MDCVGDEHGDGSGIIGVTVCRCGSGNATLIRSHDDSICHSSDDDDVEKGKATMKKVAIEEKRRGSYYSERLGCRLEGRNPKSVKQLKI